MEVYLDNSATTRAYPEVGELVYKVMCRDYGNPSSMHRKGVEAEHYVCLLYTSGADRNSNQRERIYNDMERVIW